MAEMADKHPEYEFGKHKGYGTKLHYEKLHEHGPSEIHRVSFLKKLLNKDDKPGTLHRGLLGEALALEHLIEKEYIHVADRFRSKFGEIDLIVKNHEFVVFVEVKLRKNSNFAHAREYVGKDKQWKITATANLWLASHKNELQPRFDVIEIYAPNGENDMFPEIIHLENAF